MAEIEILHTNIPAPHPSATASQSLPSTSASLTSQDTISTDQLHRTEPRSAPSSNDTNAVPIGGIRVIGHRGYLSKQDSAELAQLLMNDAHAESFRPFLQNLDHEKPRAGPTIAAKIAYGAKETIATTAYLSTEIGGYIPAMITSVGATGINAAIGLKHLVRPLPPVDAAAELTQIRGTFDHVNDALAQTEEGWHHFTDSNNEKIAPNMARAHWFTLLQHPEIRTIAERAVAPNPNWRQAHKKISRFVYAPLEIRELIQTCFSAVSIRDGTLAPERAIDATPNLSIKTSRRYLGVSKSFGRGGVSSSSRSSQPDDDIDNTQQHSIEETIDHANGLTLAATPAEISDLVTELHSQSFAPNRASAAIQTWFRSGQTDISQQVIAEHLSSGKLPPLKRENFIGLLKSGDSTVSVTSNAWTGAKGRLDLSRLPFQSRSTQPEFELLLASLAQHTDLPAITKPTALAIDMRAPNFQKGVYGELYSLFSKTSITDKKGADAPIIGTVLRPFLHAVLTRGRAGVNFRNETQSQAWDILLSNKPTFSTNNAELKTALEAPYQHVTPEMETKIAQDAAFEVLKQYVGGKFSGKEAAADLGKGMILGTGAAAGIDTLPQGTLSSYFLLTGTGGVVDTVLDNIPAAKINTRAEADDANIPFTDANIYGTRPPETLPGPESPPLKPLTKVWWGLPKVARLLISGQGDGNPPLGAIQASNLRNAILGGLIGTAASAGSALTTSAKDHANFRPQVASRWLSMWASGYGTGSAAPLTASASIRRAELAYNQLLKDGSISLDPAVAEQLARNPSGENQKAIIRRHVRDTAIREVTSRRAIRAQIKGYFFGPAIGSLIWTPNFAAKAIRKIIQPPAVGIFPGLENLGYGLFLAGSEYQTPKTLAQIQQTFLAAQIQQTTHDPAFGAMVNNSFTDMLARGFARTADVMAHPIESAAALFTHPYMVRALTRSTATPWSSKDYFMKADYPTAQQLLTNPSPAQP